MKWGGVRGPGERRGKVGRRKREGRGERGGITVNENKGFYKAIMKKAKERS